MGIIAEAYGKGDFKRLVYPKGKFNKGTTDRSVDRKFRFFFQILVAEYVAMILVFMTSRF